MAVRRGPVHSRRRRETASARAPEGTSRAMPVRDQRAKRDEICVTDRPVSLNSSAYRG
ncbi:hypothetical protein GCM10010252_49930 [Streptomyces aureoverticillatus]|nr:hypothetical protein GCM10010252_49930 [Streptomyces aureoverticillatus]